MTAMENLKKYIAQGLIWKSSCNRMLIIKAAADNFQTVLLSCEQNSYGVEECKSLQYTPDKNKDNDEEDYWQWLTEQLLNLKLEWQLGEEQLELALLVEEIYEDEFSLPLLSSKQLQQVVRQECEMHIPLEQGSYNYGYLCFPEENEQKIRVAAIETKLQEKLFLLNQKIGFKPRYLGGGGFLVNLDEATPIEFWNCFNDKVREQQLWENYRKLIVFGQACLQKRAIVNILDDGDKYSSRAVLEKVMPALGMIFLGICISGLPYLIWKNYQQHQHYQLLVQKIESDQAWTLRQQQWQKLQMEIRQRETILQKQEKKATTYEVWLDCLGKLLPVNCWLSSLETDTEGNLYLRGKSKEIGSVELFRKQLLTGEICAACELLERKADQEGKNVSFILKIKRKEMDRGR